MDIKINSETVIVFDLDDTLYNELDYLKSAYRAIALKLDQGDWKRLYSQMFSLYRSQINVFEFVVDNYDIELSVLVKMYRNHLPDIKLFDGALDLIKAIKLKEGKIGIITDGRSNTQRAKLESLDILKYIDCIIISEEIGSEKPDLANFKAIEDSLGGKVYYYIADNLKKDFIAPNSLGWRSVALLDNGKNIHFKGHNHMDLKSLPQYFIIDLKECIII